MTKHQEYYIRMIEQNRSLFDKFMDVHDKYMKDDKRWQDEYNNIGKEIVAVIREWERKLCGHSEKGQYAKFSSNLSDKFWQVVRKDFPKIDFVGVKIT